AITDAPRPPQAEVTRIDPVCAMRASASVTVACAASAGAPSLDQRIARVDAASSVIISTSRRSEGSSCTKISPSGSGWRTSESCRALAAQSAVSAHSMRFETHSCWKRSSGLLIGSKMIGSKMTCSDPIAAGSGTAVRNPARICWRIPSRLAFSTCAFSVCASLVCTKVFSPVLFPVFSPNCVLRFGRQRHRRAITVPHTHRVEDRARKPQSVKDAKSLAHRPTAKRVDPRMKHSRAPSPEHHPLTRLCSSRFGGVAPVLQKVMMQIDLYRTNARAGAAQRRRVRQVLELLDAIQMRSKHAADRPGISRAISVPSYVAEDGTDIQTRATANTVQHFALFGIGQQLAASVVDQHHMEFLRSVHFARAARTSNQRAVGRDALPSAGSSQHRPKHSQVFETRNDFLNARDHNVNARQAGAEASITFVGGNGNDAGIRHQKIRARNPHFGGKKSLAQFAARDRHQIPRIVAGNCGVQFLAE